MRRLLAWPFIVLWAVLLLCAAPVLWFVRLVTATIALILNYGDDVGFWAPITWCRGLAGWVGSGRWGEHPPLIVMHNVYCEAQGPQAGKERDHLIDGGLPPQLVTCEFGDRDQHGGRRLSARGIAVGCPRCGAPIRRFEVK